MYSKKEPEDTINKGVDVSNFGEPSEWQRKVREDRKDSEKESRLNEPTAFTVEVIGDAHVHTEDGRRVFGEVLSQFDGVECEEEFVEWMPSTLASYVKTGGLSFRYEDNTLYAVTRYELFETPDEILPNVLERLRDYTTSQWSDGIGEGFEQRPVNGYYISPWHEDQKVGVVVKDK